VRKVAKNNRAFITSLRKQPCFLCDTSLTSVIFENKECIVVLDDFPAVPGHVLCAPKRHTESLSGLTKKELQSLSALMQKVDAALRKIFKPFRVGILSSSLGVKHFHFHLVPVPNEKMMWDFKYLKKDKVIQYTPKEKSRLIQSIARALIQ
jgi:diadenosine tetraphosphate (Ap4A) HIT family hydrolase